jgi:hypothetical protein
MSKRSMLYPNMLASDDEFNTGLKQGRISRGINSSVDDNRTLSNLGGMGRGVAGTDSKGLMDPQQREAMLKEK